MNNLKTFLSNLSPDQVKYLKTGIDNLSTNNQTQGNNGLKAQYEQAIKLSEQRLNGLKQGYEKQFGAVQTTTSTSQPQTTPPTQPPVPPQSNNVEINYDALANSLANNETFQTKFKDINNDNVIDDFNDENGGLL